MSRRGKQIPAECLLTIAMFADFRLLRQIRVCCGGAGDDALGDIDMYMVPHLQEAALQDDCRARILKRRALRLRSTAAFFPEYEESDIRP